MNKRPEQRKRTQELIFQAFFAEYKVKPIRSITVGAVAKRAKINRSTFYEYFCDIYGLLDQAQDHLLGEIASRAAELIKTPEADKAAVLPQFGEQIISEYGERIALLLSHGDTGFSKKLVAAMRPVIGSMLSLDVEQRDTSLVISFVLSGITGYLTTLYATGEAFDTREAVVKLQSLMAACLAQAHE